MKTTLILILLTLCSIIYSALWAQKIEDKYSAFHLSFVPPLSTHGPLAAEYSNKVSFNILAGISKNEESFTFGGLVNIINNTARGFQFAGLSNYVGNNGQGMMFSGLANLASNNYKGFLFAGLGNSTQQMKGFQFAGLGNLAKDMNGFQFSGLGNISQDMKGFQFAGLGNIAKDVNGFQFAGLFNIAKKVSGVQFAGLINIAESSDYPLALLNILKHGEYILGVTYNEIGSTMLTLRTGGRVTYGILGIGYNHQTNSNSFTTEGGFGIHLNITKWLRINNELKGGAIGNFSNESSFFTNYALLPAFRFNPHFELFAGPSINYLNTDNPDNQKMFPQHSLWKKHTNSSLQQIYIGYQLGVQYIF